MQNGHAGNMPLNESYIWHCLLGLFNGNKEEIKRTCNIEVAKSKLMPQAIGLSDGVWAVALETKLDLSQVCKGRPTLTITATSPLSIISLPMGCTAFGTPITLPPFYQAEERFESRDSFLALSNISSARWTDLWKPLIRTSLNVTARKLPQLLKKIERIDLQDLVDQLETIDGEVLPQGSWTTESVALLSVGGCVLVGIIIIIIQVVWGRQWLKRCKKIMPARGLNSKKGGSPVETTETQGTENPETDPEKRTQAEERLQLTAVRLEG